MPTTLAMTSRMASSLSTTDSSRQCDSRKNNLTPIYFLMTKQHDEILHEKFNGVYHGNLIIFDADDMRAVKSFIVELQKAMRPATTTQEDS